MDFFVVPTLRFRLLYAWFAIDHGRRRILHFNVTESPTACWVIQQLRDAFPDEPTHRFLSLDNDAIFSPQVGASISNFGLAPKQTAFQSPWQNGTAERFVGSVRRELLDHVVVLSESHLRRLLREYVDYYNADESTPRPATPPKAERWSPGRPPMPRSWLCRGLEGSTIATAGKMPLDRPGAGGQSLSSVRPDEY